MSVYATATDEIEVDLESLASDTQRMLDELGSELEVSLLVCDDAFIQPLNAQWRDKDAPTDVLSFPQWVDVEPGVLPTDQGTLIGDIVISIDTAQRQADEQGHDLSNEFRVLVAHGLCHLLGYTHREQGDGDTMRTREGELLAVVNATCSGLIARANELV